MSVSHHSFGVPQSAGQFCCAPRRSRRTPRPAVQKEYRGRVARKLTGTRVYLSADVLLALKLAERAGPLSDEAAQVLEEWAQKWLRALSYR